MATIVFVPASGGGGPPPSGPDKFAPKYLVGNVPDGDYAIGSAAPFVYIPDPGDGSGIAAALVSASIIRGDVHVRPGTYALAAGVGPLVVPPGVRVWGAGPSTIIRSPASGNMGIFQLGAGSLLGYMRLESVQTGPSVGSVALVEASSATLLEALTIEQTLTLSGPMRGALAYSSGLPSELQNSIRDVEIRITGAGGVAPATWTRAVWLAPGASGPVVFADRVNIVGGDVGLLIEQGAWVQGQGLIDNSAARAIYLGRDGTVRIRDMRAFPAPTALYAVEGQNCTGANIFDAVFIAPPAGSPVGSAGYFFNNPVDEMIALRIVNGDVTGFGPGLTFDDGIRLEGQVKRSVVANNRIDANARGVVLDALTQNNQVGWNTVEAPIRIQDLGTGNNVSDNIPI